MKKNDFIHNNDALMSIMIGSHKSNNIENDEKLYIHSYYAKSF